MKKAMQILIFAGTLLALTVSCSQISDSRHDAILEIRNTWDDFIDSWHARDAAACAAFYAQDGLNVPNEFAANKGRQEIEAFYQFLFSMNQSSTYTHDIKSIAYAGDMAIEYGKFRVDWVSNDGSEWTYQARALTHWEKIDDEWKIKSLLFNSPPEITD